MVEKNPTATPIYKEIKERYTKLQRLGMGAFGTAFRVRSTLTKKVYILKKLDIIDMTLEERANARDNTKILGMLNHPNIIQCHDIFKDKRLCLNIVIETDGNPLAKSIKYRAMMGIPFPE